MSFKDLRKKENEIYRTLKNNYPLTNKKSNSFDHNIGSNNENIRINANELEFFK